MTTNCELHMKHLILLILFFLSANLYAQNPDGKFASVHITPSWLWGSATLNSNTSVYLPESMSYPGQYSINSHSGIMNYSPAFGIDAMVKIPTTSFLTLSFSYAFKQNYEQDINYLNYWSLNGKMHKVDFTISVYNLFSLYIE